MSKVEKKLLHYLGKAIADFDMIQRGDRIMVCLSGGKDSFTLLQLLAKLCIKTNHKFAIFAYTLDQSQPGWNDSALRHWLEERNIPFAIEKRDTYSVVKEKVSVGKSYCSLCSRLRRGNIYRYAADHKFNKIALGHHRDDLIESLLMSIFYSGAIRSMPPKLLTDDKRHIVIRPLAYCQEKDIERYAYECQFPIIPCTLCGSEGNSTRRKMKQLIAQLARENPKVPSNMLSAIGNIQISQLMDRRRWDFYELDKQHRDHNFSAEESNYSGNSLPCTHDNEVTEQDSALTLPVDP